MGPMISERFWAPQSRSTSANAQGKAVPGEIRWLSPVLFKIEVRQHAWPTARELRVSAHTVSKIWCY
jgi:hypothetical protein